MNTLTLILVIAPAALFFLAMIVYVITALYKSKDDNDSTSFEWNNSKINPKAKANEFY